LGLFILGIDSVEKALGAIPEFAGAAFTDNFVWLLSGATRNGSYFFTLSAPY
jgi:hypothetical protein